MGVFLVAKSVVHQAICSVERWITIAARIKILQGFTDMISGGTEGVFNTQFVIWPRGKSSLLPSSTSVTLFSLLQLSSISLTLFSSIGDSSSFVISL